MRSSTEREPHPPPALLPGPLGRRRAHVQHAPAPSPPLPAGHTNPCLVRRAARPRRVATCPCPLPSDTSPAGLGFGPDRESRPARTVRSRCARAHRPSARECAYAVSRTGTYLAERFRQVLRRRGKNRAITAVGHDILTTAWWLLFTGQPYRDPGPDSLRRQTEEQARRRVLRQLERMGLAVALTPGQPAD